MIPETPKILRQVAVNLKKQGARNGDGELAHEAWHLEQAANEIEEYRKLFQSIGNIITNVQKEEQQ